MFFLFIFLVGSVSATIQTQGPFPQNSNVNLLQVGNGFTHCNITEVLYPGNLSNVGLLEVNMSKNGDSYHYVLGTSYTNQIGTYVVNGFCTDGVENVPFSYNLLITANGVEQTTSQGIGSAIFLFLMLALTALFGFIGFKLGESDKLWILGIFFMFLSFIFIVYDVYLGYEYHKNFTGLSNSAMPELLFYIFLFLLVVGLLSSIALLFLRWKDLFKWFKREIKKKDTEDEDVEDWDLDKQ